MSTNVNKHSGRSFLKKNVFKATEIQGELKDYKWNAQPLSFLGETPKIEHAQPLSFFGKNTQESKKCYYKLQERYTTVVRRLGLKAIDKLGNKKIVSANSRASAPLLIRLSRREEKHRLVRSSRECWLAQS